MAARVGKFNSKAAVRGAGVGTDVLEARAAARVHPHLADPDAVTNPLLKFDNSPANVIAWQASMLPVIAGVFGGAGQKLGKYVGYPFRLVEKGLLSTHNFLYKNTLGDVVKDASLEPKAATKASIERHLEGMGRRVENTITDGPLKFMGDWRDTRVEHLREKGAKYAKNAAADHAAGLKRLDKVDDALKALPAGDSRFAKLREAVADARRDLGKVAPSGDAQALTDREGILTAREKAFNEAMLDLKRQGGLSGAEREALKTVERKFSGRIGGFFGYTKVALKSHNPLIREGAMLDKAAFREDFAAGFKALPTRLSKVPVGKVLEGGLYYTTQAATALRTAKLLSNDVDILKHMESSITGKDINSISTWQVMFGKVPKAMREARHQFMLSAGPQATANLLGMGAFHKMMQHGGAGGKALVAGVIVQMGAGMAGSFIADKNSLLEDYSKMVRAQDGGQELPPGAYLAFLVHASKKVRQMDQDDKSLLDVAKQYAAEKATPGQVMKELADGKFSERLAAARQSNVLSEAKKNNTRQGGGDVARARLSHNTEQPVVGAHTLKESARRIGRAAIDAGQVTNVASMALD